MRDGSGNMYIGDALPKNNCRDFETQASFPFRDYVLVYILLCFSGNVTFVNLPYFEFLQVIFICYLINCFILHNRYFINQKFFFISCIYLSIFTIQSFQFKYFPIITISGFFVRLYMGFAVIFFLKDFLYIYIRVIIILSIVSLLFYGLQEVGYLGGIDFRFWFKSIGDFFTESTQRIPFFIHTYLTTEGDHRNSGMFWEPGAFAGYLVLAMIALEIKKNEISKNDYIIFLLILSVTLLTTMSTTGYVVYPFILLLQLRSSKMTGRNRFRKSLLMISVILPISVLIFFASYQRIPFLKNKILEQFQQVEYAKGQWHLTRFGSILFDWEYIKERPITGWGLHSSTRYSLDPNLESVTGMGNGFSDFCAKFGVLGILTWLFAVFYGFRKIYRGKTYHALITCLVIVVLLQGESFLNYPMFISLAFISESALSFSKKIYCT